MRVRHRDIPITRRCEAHAVLATLKQIAANQKNALRSSGPTTREGKAVSRLNAVKHGLTATLSLLPGEDPAEFEQLVAGIRERFAPSDRLQDMLVMRAANLMWRLRRAGYFETSLVAWAERDAIRKDELTSHMRIMRSSSRLPLRDPANSQQTADLDDYHRVGRTVQKLFDNGDVLNRLLRYETGLIRQLEQTLNRLTLLKKVV